MNRTCIMPAAKVQRILDRLAYEVIERNQGAENLMLFGIRTRGTALALALADRINAVEALSLDVHKLRVEAYRDDRDTPPAKPSISPDDAPDITGRTVVLVDDVLFTGRTSRAALDALVRFGRPQSIQMVALIDRGHREYPIQADYVGRSIPTKYKERVVVEVDETIQVFVEE
ncbi:MAG: bifunctional pyr operon transcriptional regulator/uracil phosphoribosyltransferase PyrR [Rhodothermales bacterium]